MEERLRGTALTTSLNPRRGSRIKDAHIKIMADIVRDTVILGSGCAGLTAAIYTARANLKPLGP